MGRKAWFTRVPWKALHGECHAALPSLVSPVYFRAASQDHLPFGRREDPGKETPPERQYQLFETVDDRMRSNRNVESNNWTS